MFSPPLSEINFPEAYAFLLKHIPAFFTFKTQGLFLSGFSELMLKRIFLPTVTLLLPFMVALTFSQGSALSCLVQAYAVNLMTLTLWTVRANLFWNVHATSLWLAIEKTFTLLYFFRYSNRYIALRTICNPFYTYYSSWKYYQKQRVLFSA